MYAAMSEETHCRIHYAEFATAQVNDMVKNK